MRIFYRPQPDEITQAAAPISLPEDDGWQLCGGGNVAMAAAVAATALLTQACTDQLFQNDVQEPAGSLFGQPDEDFWQNRVAPVGTTHYVRLPIGDPEEIPAGVLFGVPDELSFRPPLPWPIPPPPQALTDTDDIVPQPVIPLPPDEDFFRPGMSPPGTNFLELPYLPDADDLPALFPILPFQPDEDLFRPPAPQPQPWVFPALVGQDEDAPSGLRGQPDEDFFRPPPPWPAQVNAPLVLVDAGEIAFPPLDEDFWTCQVPATGTTHRPLYLPDAEQTPATGLHGMPDEDYWQCRVPHAPAVTVLRLPYLPEPEQVWVTTPLANPDNRLDTVVVRVVARETILLQQPARETVAVKQSAREPIILTTRS